MDEREIFERAKDAFDARKAEISPDLFLNIRVKGHWPVSVDDFTDINVAAEYASDSDTLGRYFGTLHVTSEGATWICLRQRHLEVCEGWPGDDDNA